MEAAVRKWLCEDWNLSELHKTIDTIKETEINKTIMFRIGKLLGGKVTTFKWKIDDDEDEQVFIFTIIYNGETEKHIVKIYEQYPQNKIKFDNYVDNGRMKTGKEFPLPRKDINKKDIMEKYDEIKKQIRNISKITRKTYNEYDTYPIYRNRQKVILLLLAQRDKNSILSTLPKDILILIAKKI